MAFENIQDTSLFDLFFFFINLVPFGKEIKRKAGETPNDLL
jgi:hypothetical protein